MADPKTVTPAHDTKAAAAPAAADKVYGDRTPDWAKEGPDGKKKLGRRPDGTLDVHVEAGPPPPRSKTLAANIDGANSTPYL